MLNSINTNTGAMAALRSLNATAAELVVVRQRVSTGRKVSSARDNGAAWSIAQAQRADVRAFDAVLSSLQRGRTAVDLAMAAGTTVSELLTEMKAKALAASDTGLDAQSRTALNEEFKSLRDQIATVAKAADSGGVNLLRSGATNVEFLAGLRLMTFATPGGGGNGNGNAGGNGNGNAGGNGNGGGNNAGGVGSAPTRLTVRAEVMSLGGANVTITAAASFSSASDAAALAAQVQTSLDRVVLSVARLGTSAAGFDAQYSFISRMQSALEAGVGALVDADLARESARMQALQTRQQLAIESLGIANRAPGALLRLFNRPTAT